MDQYQGVDPDRQIRLKEIIAKLHAGGSVGEVKKEFARLIQGVNAAEIAAMEQSLIDGGMPVEEVQRLCEVHVQVFETSLAKGGKPSGIPGHPVHTMLEENKIARKKLSALKAAARARVWGTERPGAAEESLESLSRILVHYARKENQLFPYLEKQGFTGPSRVMWGKHDEIRALFKEAKEALDGDPRVFQKLAKTLGSKLQKMIFMEEHILIPEAARRLSDREWALIRRGEDAIGFSWIAPASLYDAELVLAKAGEFPRTVADAASEGKEKGGNSPGVRTNPAKDPLDLSTGLVPKEVLDLALKTLPVDISIVDENDRVIYYSDSPHRLFPRSPAAIGRTVQNCHPQKSVDTVNKILVAFRNKEKDKARFWIERGGRFILIEYYALYDGDGAYKGTLEVSQDLTDLRALEGQRHLLDWS